VTGVMNLTFFTTRMLSINKQYQQSIQMCMLVPTYAASPADSFDLSPSRFIKEVNGSKTPKQDVFIEQVVGITDHVY
jgi:hypothetical protein